MYATNYFENAILNLMRNTAIQAPSTMYLALFLSNPSDTGTAGTEASYTGYTRVPVVFRAPYAQSTGSQIYILENSAEISFPESSSSGTTITHVAVMDAITGGNMWLYGPLDTSLIIQSGVTPVFRQGTLQWTWSGNVSSTYKIAVMNTMRGQTCSGFNPYLALCDANGNEFNGTNYARFAVTMTQPQQNPNTDVAYSQNTAEVSSNIAGNDWGTVKIVKMFISQTGNGEFLSTDLTGSYNITTGSLFGFHAGDFVVNIN